jgi:hypothetical protein
MSALQRLVEAAANARKVILDHYNYVAPLGAIGAGGTGTFTIPIQNDSDFLWVGTTLTVFTAVNVLDPAPDIVWGVTDAGSARLLQSANMPALGSTGNGQWPFLLPAAKLFVGNGSITVDATDRSGVAKAQVDFVFIGFKIFYAQGFNREQLLSAAF